MLLISIKGGIVISLFDYYPDTTTNVVFPGNWGFIKQGYLKNIEQIKNYYRLYPTVLNSAHFLIRLIESLAVPMEVNLQSYYNSIDAKVTKLAMSFGITSPSNKGTVFEGIFYGKGSVELLVLDDAYFDLKEANQNWEYVSAVVPLLHPKSDLELLLPTGQQYSKETGLAVFSINIALLAVQYRAFLNAQDQDCPNPATTFIASYVLPNMLTQHAEIALFNRLYNLAIGLNDGSNEVHHKHSFVVPNYTAYLDLSLLTTLSNIAVGIKRFETILKTIPAFNTINIYQALIIPDIAPTNQVDWLLTITRLKMIHFLILVTGNECYNKNAMCLTQVLRSFHSNNVTSVLMAMLPTSIIKEISGYHSTIKQIITSDNLSI